MKIVTKHKQSSKNLLELLKQPDKFEAKRRWTQLIKLKRAIVEKHPKFATRHETIILYHDNA